MTEIKILKNVLDKNQDRARKNRDMLLDQKIRMINLISSPGAGKTSILEKAIPLLQSHYSIAVIEGDAYTSRDAERLQKFNIPVIQINTEGSCHLDSNSIFHAFKELDFTKLDLIIVENVGNLICPVAFDLGEEMRIAVLSTTEGEDKPAKYPMLFREASTVLLNKIDLLPYLEFDKNSFLRDIFNINPELTIFETSATQNSGISEFVKWLINSFDAE